MQFIRNHYEKILLGVVLLGLVGLLVAMWFVIEADKQRMADLRMQIFPANPKPVEALDLSHEDATMARLASPGSLDFSSTNRLFNPVQWIKEPSGMWKKIDNDTKVGIGAVVVTKITPLYFTISLDAVTTNELGARYSISIADETATLPVQRHPRRHFASLGKGNDTVVDKAVGGKDEGFKLVDVKGPPENPDALVLKLAETGEAVEVAKDKPYRRVDGYTADLKYDPENYKATGLRVGSFVKFGGDEYNIIAIGPDAVVLLAQSNQKKWTRPYAP